MSFGYSAGDFFTATSLIIQAGFALRDAGGSAQEYRQLNLYLSTVRRVLGEVDKLQAVEGLAETVNAIKATAVTCQYPLREFLKSIEHYGPSLALGESVGLTRDTEKKLRWRATNKIQAAERLQGQLAGYVGSINMLMGLYQIRSNAFAAKTNDARLENLAIAAKGSNEASEEIRNEVRDCRASLPGDVKASGETTSMAIMSLQTSIYSMFRGITGLVGDLKDVMMKSYSTNMETYNLLVSIQAKLPAPDTRHTFFQDPMQIEDAFGRLFPVPVEYSRQMLEAVVKARFARGPGHEFVEKDDWQLFWARDCRWPLDESWTVDFRPGMKLIMAVTVPRIEPKMRCPRPNCPSTRYLDAHGGGKTCASCNVWFRDLPFLRSEFRGLEIKLNEPNKAVSGSQGQFGEIFHPDLLYLKNVSYRAPIPGPGALVRAVWDYQNDPECLDIKEGDTIKVMSRNETGWWDGMSNGRRGWFPMNYCTPAE